MSSSEILMSSPDAKVDHLVLWNRTIQRIVQTLLVFKMVKNTNRILSILV
jgi:hypothetical protein